ncbi:FMN-binding negative transcriptional regulator [Streptomyces sp. 1331.2]|uniref:FMN-binding negative transcriptional regulator n=1 Tax=Streptomyces sp. 1331.2 TaxID=1938835 RepID=UPI000BD9AB5B|nr:FMN-binding negative transcriptional regulator [Streptomyces sp. 1331.2]SOB80093.1 negative transcriptional regulator, PaiB family [Streptomyces sp. 1331.2]
MLIRSWDRGDEDEWRAWLAEGRDFGLLAANGGPGEGPVLVPTHFLLDAERGEILLHLAAPNPLLAAVRADPQVTLAVTDGYAFAPGHWRGAPGTPTSYYTSVHFHCTAEVVESAADKAEILNRQLAHFQPETPEVRVVPGDGELARQLPGLRGLRLTVNEVRAKFKYDDKKPAEAQFGIAERLAERAGGRGRGRDQYAAARSQLLRRHGRRTALSDTASSDTDPSRAGTPRAAAPRTTAPRTTAPRAAD